MGVINVNSNDFSVIIETICDADSHILDRSELSIGQMEVFYNLSQIKQ